MKKRSHKKETRLPRDGPCTRLCLLQPAPASTSLHSQLQHLISTTTSFQRPQLYSTASHPQISTSSATREYNSKPTPSEQRKRRVARYLPYINEISTPTEDDIPNPEPLCAATKHSTKQYKAATARTSSLPISRSSSLPNHESARVKVKPPQKKDEWLMKSNTEPSTRPISIPISEPRRSGESATDDERASRICEGIGGVAWWVVCGPCFCLIPFELGFLVERGRERAKEIGDRS
jgi:hypothetical protein